MFCDIALDYNPVTARADMVFDGRGLVLDTTSRTALIVSLGTERRADPDDVLPGTVDPADVYANSPEGRPNPRRGYVGDGLDPGGRRMGCRLWLLDDAKQTQDTRLLAIAYAEEGMAWMPDATGVTPAADASWIRRNTLAILGQAGGMTLRLPLSLT